jgi:hypothetical protein
MEATMPKKVKLRVNIYKVVSEAVEQGVTYGYRRAHKHVDNPDEEHMKQELFNGVLNALCEVIDFD